jgi:hypothetical protein
LLLLPHPVNLYIIPEKRLAKIEGSEVAIIAVLADGRMGGRANSSNTKILLFAIELFYFSEIRCPITLGYYT